LCGRRAAGVAGAGRRGAAAVALLRAGRAASGRRGIGCALQALYLPEALPSQRLDEERTMKSTAIGLAGLLAMAASAYAAEPAKLMDSSAGKIWTDAKGMTLYTFDKDAAGTSNCYDKCAAAWPPLAATADAKAEGEWTVVERTDGT